MPGWVWNPKAERWQVTVAAVRVSAEQHGSLSNVARDTRVDEVHVARWATYQRHRHSRGLLTPQETAALEAVPGWWWTPAACSGRREATVRATTDHQAGVPAATEAVHRRYP